MKILAVGDVCGTPGVDFVAARLSRLKRELGADLTVVNGENTCVRGISPSHADQLFDAGADVITLGNHTYDNRQICNYLDDTRYIIRPANMPIQRPGVGHTLVEQHGRRICVINLMGRVHTDFNLSSPFAVVDSILSTVEADLYLVDFHAEATSEKLAMAYHLDGRVAALWGTHTHVQTADERVFKGGMGYITDLGMTGGLDSVIGVKAEQSLGSFLGHLQPRFEAADRDLRIQGALFDIDADGRCTRVLRVNAE